MVKLYIPMNPIVHSLKMLSNGILEIAYKTIFSYRLWHSPAGLVARLLLALHQC